MALVLGSIIAFAPNLTKTPRNPFSDSDFVQVGILYGISSILFVMAVFTTTTAHLVFILAFNPLLAALFAWWLIGEKPGIVTWLAIGLTTLGVSIIVLEGFEGDTQFGDLIALATSVVLGLSVVKTRQTGKDMSLSACLGGMLAGAFALPMALMHFEWPLQPGWLILNALVMAPAAAFALSLAPRYIPAPQVSMFFLLETVLAPIWVWLIFSETLTLNTVIGGSIVLTAIGAHSYIQLSRSMRQRKQAVSEAY